MNCELGLVEALDGLRNAIENRNTAQAAYEKFDGEVARLSGVVSSLLAAPQGKITVEAVKSGPRKAPAARRADVAVLEKLRAAPAGGLPSRAALPPGSSGWPLSLLKRQGLAKKLPNGNWAAV